MLASVPLVIEYEAVLTRPEHPDASGLTSRQVNEVLDALVKVSTPVPFRFLRRPRLKDPADEMVLETAVNGGLHRPVAREGESTAETCRSRKPSGSW